MLIVDESSSSYVYFVTDMLKKACDKGSRSTFEFPSRVPVCLYLAQWTGLAGATRLTVRLYASYRSYRGAW